MKTAILAMVFLSLSSAYGKTISHGLRLSGIVPLVAHVTVEKDSLGHDQVVDKSSRSLKTETLRRGPASIVRVSAP